MESLKIPVSLVIIAALVQMGMFKECIKTKLGRPCTANEDCYGEKEFHLYCNKSFKVNVCGFYLNTYIGHAVRDMDCEGPEYSAAAWTNPIPTGLAVKGMDCMRLCLHTHTCFGLVIDEVKRKCYLKNDKCFTHLKRIKGRSVSVLNVVREDYRCGCHYPFTRVTSTGKTLTWAPDCPEAQKTRSPYRCCSDKGLCIPCPGDGSNTTNVGTFDLK